MLMIRGTKSMHIIFQCPVCSRQQLFTPGPGEGSIRCECGWNRELPSSATGSEALTKCLVCGCDDLWRQKDFPPALGLLFVGLGILFSSIAWYLHLPVVALGILMGFAMIDMLLYTFMGDMLVCYRCRSRHRKGSMSDDHPKFDLETAERYRQQELRQTTHPADRH
jgi:hypothetical protein